MKQIKRCLCNFSYYDQRAIQETLERMAAEGWMLQRPGSFLWRYERCEPRALRFCVTFFPGGSEFDPVPTEGELTKIDFCARDGWVLAASWGSMQIFYNEDPNAVPIETEPVTQVENIRRTLRKNVLFPQLIMCVSLLFYIAIQLWQLKNDPVEYLSNAFYLYSALTFGLLLLSSLHEIGFCLWWSRRAARAAREDGVFLPIRSRPAATYALLALSLLFWVLSYSALRTTLGYVLLWPCAAVVLIAAGRGIKAALKRRGVSRGVNLAVSVGSIVVLSLVCMGLLTAALISGRLHIADGKTVVGTYELYGRTVEIYDDPLPLEIEDLAAVTARWSKEADHRETVLLSSTEYCQRAVPDGRRQDLSLDEHELKYTVTDVKWGFLYSWVKEAVLRARQDEDHGDFVFTDHYEPVDAAPWGADAAYQLHWSDSVLDTYLLCWGSRIVELTFYWEPTAEQIAAAAEALRQAPPR